MSTRRDIFNAIAHPKRRAIISFLANNKLTLNGLAERFDVSRPAISRHIKILAECGLIVIEHQGREHFCKVRLERLTDVSDWIDQYKKFWKNKVQQSRPISNRIANIRVKQ